MLQHLESLPIGTLAHTHTNTQQNATYTNGRAAREREKESVECVEKKRRRRLPRANANRQLNTDVRKEIARSQAKFKTGSSRVQANVGVGVDVVTPKWRDRVSPSGLLRESGRAHAQRQREQEADNVSEPLCLLLLGLGLFSIHFHFNWFDGDDARRVAQWAIFRLIWHGWLREIISKHCCCWLLLYYIYSNDIYNIL